MIFLRQRHRDPDHCPLPRRSLDGERAPNILHPLAHAGQSDTRDMAHPVRIKTGSVVRDAHRQAAGRMPNIDIHPLCMGMLGNIAQAFLHNPIDAKSYILGDVVTVCSLDRKSVV